MAGFDLKGAMAAAMGGGAGKPMAGPPMGGSEVEPRTPVDKDPTTQAGDKFFLDPSMLPDGKKCKKGEELTLRVRVDSIGSKIALTPLEVLGENNGEEMGEVE